MLPGSSAYAAWREAMALQIRVLQVLRTIIRPDAAEGPAPEPDADSAAAPTGPENAVPAEWLRAYA